MISDASDIVIQVKQNQGKDELSKRVQDVAFRAESEHAQEVNFRNSENEMGHCIHQQAAADKIKNIHAYALVFARK